MASTINSTQKLLWLGFYEYVNAIIAKLEQRGPSNDTFNKRDLCGSIGMYSYVELVQSSIQILT